MNGTGSKFTVPQASTATANFVKNNGVWAYVQPLPVIAHTITAADATLISNSTFGTANQRADLAKYGDFSGWSVGDLKSSFTLVLTTDYPTPVTNTDYEITYLNYTGGSDVPTIATFIWSGTAWVAQQ